MTIQPEARMLPTHPNALITLDNTYLRGAASDSPDFIWALTCTLKFMVVYTVVSIILLVLYWRLGGRRFRNLYTYNWLTCSRARPSLFHRGYRLLTDYNDLRPGTYLQYRPVDVTSACGGHRPGYRDGLLGYYFRNDHGDVLWSAPVMPKHSVLVWMPQCCNFGRRYLAVTARFQRLVEEPDFEVVTLGDVETHVFDEDCLPEPALRETAGFFYTETVRENVTKVSFCEENYINVTIDKKHLLNFMYRLDLTVKGIGVGSIEHIGSKLKVPDISVNAVLIHRFCLAAKQCKRTVDTFPEPEIQQLNEDLPFQASSKKIGQYLLSNTPEVMALPFRPTKAVILRDHAAELYANKLRLCEPRDMALKKVASGFRLLVDGQIKPVSALAKEFLELLIPVAHVGSLQDELEVFERQNRPMQVANRVEAKDLLFMNADEKVFLKNEVAKFGAPARIIVSFGARLSILQGCLYGAFAKCLKSTKHYGFLAPEHLQSAMEEIAASSPVFETDFSKMDATVTDKLRDVVELAALMRYFREDEHEYIKELFKSTHGFTARAKRVAFNIGDSRASGASDTSTMNTLLSMFFIYCAYRHSGLSPDLAWARPYLCGGDDVVGSKLSPEILEDVGSALGFSVKAELKVDGEPFSFLAKFYMLAPSLHGFMVPDPYRTLTSLCITHIVDVPREQVALRKARSFLDEWGDDIPVLSALCRYYCRRCRWDKRYDHINLDVLGYYSRYVSDRMTTFNPRGISRDAASAFIAERLGLGGVGEIIAIEDMYNNASRDSDLHSRVWCPVFEEKVVFPLLYGGERYIPPAPDHPYEFVDLAPPFREKSNK